MSLLRVFLRVLFLVSVGHGAAAGDISEAPSDKAHYYKMNFTGPITPGDVFRLQKHLAEIPEAVRHKITKKKIYLDSEGGDLEEGLALGRAFRKYQIRTEVPKDAKCKSACALAFLGGTTENSGIALRTKASLGVVGFHGYRLDGEQQNYKREIVEGAVRKSQQTMLDLVKYFLEVDGDPRILDRIVATPPGSMNYISDSDALEFCIFVDKEGDPGENTLVNPYELKYVQPASAGIWQQSRCKYP